MRNKINPNILFERLLFISLAFLPLLAITWNLDNDFWFLLSHGREVLTSDIPTIEPLTIHENFDFVMQQWLFSTIAWSIYSKYGEVIIIVLLTVLALFLGFLLFSFSYICSGKKIKIASLITLISFLGISCFFVVTRPQVITYILIVIELIFLEKYAKTENIKYLFVLPLVSVLQINIHASMWVMLFVFALPYIVNSFSFSFWDVKSTGFKKVPLLIALATMFLCGFVNPYGIKAMTYVFSSYGQKLLDSTITEMAIISVRETHGLLFFALLFLALLLFRSQKKTQIELRYELLFYGTIVLTLLSQKSLAYFMIGCIPFFASGCQFLEDKIIVFNGNEKRSKALKVILPVYLVLIIICGVGVRINNYSSEESLPTSYKAIDYLSEIVSDKDDVKVYTGYDSGGYAEFKGFKVYMDARAEVFLKDNNNQKDVFSEYIEMQYGKTHYKDVLNKYNFSYLVVDRSDILFTYLSADTSYDLIYEDSNTKIFIPKI